MKQPDQADLQELLTKAMSSQDMQALLTHPKFPKQDGDITRAMETIATKLAAGPGYAGMGGYSSQGAGIRKQYIEDTVDEFTGGTGSAAEDPAYQLSEGAQQAVIALRLLQQQEEHESAKKLAEVEARKPSAIGMILEAIQRPAAKAAKNVGDYSTDLLKAIQGSEDPMTSFRLSPPSKKTEK